MIGTILLIFIAVFIFIKLFNSFGNSNYDTDNYKESEAKIKTALNLKSHDDSKVNGTIQAIDDNLVDDIMQIKSTFDNFVPEVFLKQSEQTFDKIFNAFVDSNHQTLKELLSENLYEGFAKQIKKRDDKNLRQEMTIEHKKTSLEKIYFSSDSIQLTVSFEVMQMVAMVDINGKSLDNPNKISRKVKHCLVFETPKKAMNWIIVKTNSNEIN